MSLTKILSAAAAAAVPFLKTPQAAARSVKKVSTVSISRFCSTLSNSQQQETTDSSELIRMQFKNNPDLRYFILRNSKRYGGSIDELVYFDSSANPLANVHRLIRPCRTIFRQISIIGVSKGVVCLLHDAIVVMFWNPLTGTYRRIPPFDHKDYTREARFFFGHDDVSDEFKVLITQDGRECEIYSSKMDSWKKIEVDGNDTRRFDDKSYCSDVVEGASNALHIVVCKNKVYYRSDERGESIMAFDLSTEDFNDVPLPVIRGYISHPLSLIGCLCFHEIEDECTSLWMMKKYGDVESWTKLFSADFDHNLRALEFINGGREVLLCRDSCYDDREVGKVFYSYNMGGENCEGSVPSNKANGIGRFEDLLIYSKPQRTVRSTFVF